MDKKATPSPWQEAVWAEAKAVKSPTWLELESVIMGAKTVPITSLSWATIKRRYPHLVIKLSPRREGMKLRDALAIASGKARET